MRSEVVIGVDIGTSSSKAVAVSVDGRIVARAIREHTVDRPFPGHVEMNAAIWWAECVELCRELVTASNGATILAVGLSGMGPCVLITDLDCEPLRPAILYGVDTRATPQINRLTREFGGASRIMQQCGSALSTQSVGPKLAWLADNEADRFALARRIFMPSSWLVWNLTGQYVLDHHSASQCTPLYDTQALDWYKPWAQKLVGAIALPRLLWAGEIAGRITATAAALTGLPVGTPVIAGTIDAWAEAVSVGAQAPGDLMVMYGTTMFLINTVSHPVIAEGLWSTVGALPGTRNLAGGMATSGAITNWLRNLFEDVDFADLTELARNSGPGARGLLMLPYFAGERTPIADPNARGVIAGLSLSHSRGDLYRAALEATAFGVRHNVETMTAAGASTTRAVAVGGGVAGGLWTQIVSDVTGLDQSIPSITIGASYGSAFLAASTLADVQIDIWNPVESVISPRATALVEYDGLYALYRSLYTSTARIVHELVGRQA